jgi:hypothetical protein
MKTRLLIAMTCSTLMACRTPAQQATVSDGDVITLDGGLLELPNGINVENRNFFPYERCVLSLNNTYTTGTFGVQANSKLIIPYTKLTNNAGLQFNRTATKPVEIELYCQKCQDKAGILVIEN